MTPHYRLKDLYPLTFSDAPSVQPSSLYTSMYVIRHTRREAGIQGHGWRVQM